MFAKKTKASCAGLTVCNNQKKDFESSRGKDFARLSNGQRRLIE